MWRGIRRLAVVVVIVVAAAAAPVKPAHAAPLSTTTTTAAVAWQSSTALRYVDLNADARVVDPQFSWDPIPQAAKYEVEINSSDLWAVGSRVCCDGKSIGTSLSPVKLLPNNTYYWRMRAIDASGAAGQWNVWCGNGVPSCAAPQGFDKTFDNVAPTIPRLRVRDSSGDAEPATGPSGLPTANAPVLAWDPVPGASSYELRVSPWVTANGGYCDWTSLPGRTFTTAATAWTPLAFGSGSPVGNAYPSVSGESQFLVDGNSYCVRARARSDRDALGGDIVSDWTQIGGLGHAAFTYQSAVLPACGPAATPAAAYHIEPSPVTPTPRMPLFTWDRVPGACGYYIVVARDPEFTKIADVAFTTVPAYAPRKGTGPTTYTDETTNYYWAVMPSVTSTGGGVSTQPQEDHPQPFDKRSQPPALLAPAGGVSGVPSFRWTAAEGARDYRIQVDDEPTFGTPITDVVTASTAYTTTSRYPSNTTLYWRVRANDETGVGLSWSDTGTFTALPPETSIDSGPELTGSFATFTFASDVPDSSFKCKLDGPGTKVGILVACSSPAGYGPLVDGTYRFTVTATDLGGNADPTPATRTFTVDTSLPDTRISTAPPSPTNSPAASFAFVSTKAGSTFECKLDMPGGGGGVWAPCISPAGYATLADGGYVFSVRATDSHGYMDPTPATDQFTVDTAPPDTTITEWPGSGVSDTASLAFTASEPATFECRLDGPGAVAGRWEACGSPSNFDGLAAGSYRFAARATDIAGNADPTPATRSFAVSPPPSPVTEVPMPDITVPPSPTPAAGIPAPKQVGQFTFRAPRKPVPVRRGRARLRFECVAADGCAAARFAIRRSRLMMRTVVLEAGPHGTRFVTIKIDRATRRALARAGRHGLGVSLGRTGASARRFRLVAGAQ